MRVAPTLKRFEQIVGEDVIKGLQEKAEKLSKLHIVCISSTFQGGGVAEILNSAVFLFNEIGIDFGWRILHGTSDFFTVTKKLHNALQGEEVKLTDKRKRIYYETNKRFSTFTHVKHDLVVVHDPQPLPLIEFYDKKQPWIFRCHVDLSNPHGPVWEYLKQFIDKYDHFVVSRDGYQRGDLRIPQSVIYPAIDPLLVKNQPLSDKRCNKYLQRFGIRLDKPIIAQVSRFDKWKDPLGVVKVFNLVRKETDCQLVLLGSLAPDDPEGQKIYQTVEKEISQSKHREDIKILLVHDDFLVNCLQRTSAVIVQKSLKEGFGLTVSEALFKKTPVVASNVGGISLQVIDGENGFLHEPKDYKGFSKSILTLLADKKLRESFGEKGREHVKKNFLMTRLLGDWLDLFAKYRTAQK